MERAEDEVAGLRRGQRERDGLEIAELADEDDIRILTERAAQRGRERFALRADLALIDERLLRLVDELDGVLERQDVTGLGLVDEIDHRRERGRLAAAGRSRHEDEALLGLRQGAEHRREPEVLEARDLLRDLAEDGALAAVVHERVDAEASAGAERVGEVDLEVLLEVTALVVVHHLEDQAVRLVGKERGVIDAHEVALDADHRRLAGGEVEVGGPALHGEAKQIGRRKHQSSSMRSTCALAMWWILPAAWTAKLFDGWLTRSRVRA